MPRGRRYDFTPQPGFADERVGYAASLLHEESERLYDLLAPGGRLLNHAIASVGGSRLGRRTFVNRYVFPDGDLLPVEESIEIAERAGFELRKAAASSAGISLESRRSGASQRPFRLASATAAASRATAPSPKGSL